MYLDLLVHGPASLGEHLQHHHERVVGSHNHLHRQRASGMEPVRSRTDREPVRSRTDREPAHRLVERCKYVLQAHVGVVPLGEVPLEWRHILEPIVHVLWGYMRGVLVYVLHDCGASGAHGGTWRAHWEQLCSRYCAWMIASPAYVSQSITSTWQSNAPQPASCLLLMAPSWPLHGPFMVHVELLRLGENKPIPWLWWHCGCCTQCHKVLTAAGLTQQNAAQGTMLT